MHRFASTVPWVRIVLLVVISRALLSLLGVVSTSALDQVRPPETEVQHAALEVAREEISSYRAVHLWYNWDAQHYENLSRTWLTIDIPVQPNVVTPDGGRGWNEFSWPPLYPVVIAAIHWVVPVDAGLIMVVLGNIFFALMLFYVYRIAKHDGLDDAAANAVLLSVVAFPFSFFLSVPLTEPLFIALAAAALYAVRRQQWVYAGLASVLMTWTKMTGVLMAVPLAVAAGMTLFAERPKQIRRVATVLAAPVICLAGYAAYLGFAWWLTGTPRAPFLTQRYGWGNSVGNPVVNLLKGLDRWQYLAVLALLVIAVVLGVRGWMSAVDTTYCIVMLLSTATITGLSGAAPRYAAAAFPIAMSIERWGRRHRVGDALIAGAAALQGGLFVLWANYWLTAMW